VSRTILNAALIAIAAALPTLPAMAQNAPVQLAPAQTMDPPGTAELKPAAQPKAVAAKGKAASGAKTAPQKTAPQKTAAAPKAVPVDPAQAASAAGIEAAGAAAAHAPKAKAKAKAKSADAVDAKPIPPVKKVKLKKGAKPSSTAPIEAIAPDAAPARLTGEAAWAKMVGNSINGVYEGSAMIDAYLPDNTVKTKSRGETSVGRWGMVDGRACFQYAPEPQATCYEVALEGDQVTYTDESGEVLHFTLSPGIPSGM
jgi:hypothetical protein